MKLLNKHNAKVELTESALSGKKHQSGYSILELLVAMTLGVLVLSSAVTLQVTNREDFKSTTSELEMKTSAKMAAEFIGTSLRGVGVMGCRTIDGFQTIRAEDRVAQTESSYNIVLNSAQSAVKYIADADFFAGHEILGYDASGSGWSPLPDASLNLTAMTTGSDAITLRGGVGESYVLTNGRAFGDTQYSLSIPANTDVRITTNNYAVASTCKNAEVFKVTSSDAAIDLGNVGRDAGGGANDNSQGSMTKEFGIDKEGFAELRRVATTSYYISNNNQGIPTLYRNIDGVSSPLVEGVEHMMLDYGVENSVTLRNVAGQYLTAGAIQASCANPLPVPVSPSCLWPSVVSVRVSFVMRSREEIYGKNITKVYTLPGASDQVYSKADRYSRSIYSSTFVVRNRMIGKRT
ncbi:hypothetical protein MNBD_GAMMA10-262 [hydrothermal vent metagenome]|uniref:Type IV fimbrial biogenesis protein PilW n=1 Tax=hydrothermal vent metagenome TaxID=652676 RepID=A0A3B0XNN5_9ZZZZ